ncbi:MAG: exodeoxyribonuclease III [Candidatus Falkowbacteria bacterium]|nr:exodeoxyribonuclease III [Candidatus Falkowbacteria bacterium]
MKIISWNINGIRAVLKKGFTDFIRDASPDILCLQEIKISRSTQEESIFDFAGYREYWNSAVRPGYSGTAVLIHEDFAIPISIRNGFGEKKFDDEGRTQILEFADFYLVNCYFPNANHELSRLDYKMAYNDYLQKNLKKLEKTKAVVICGDFNVAHQEIDLARPKENVGNPGFTAEERSWMDAFVAAGFIDSFRLLNNDKIQYSWWSYRALARVRNVGWRIDYFCVSAKIKQYIKKAFISDQVLGSDHAPVGIETEGLKA